VGNITEGEEKMGTKDKERRVYFKEFKAEAVMPTGKHEKPVRRAVVDLGVNENMPYRWIRQSREAGGTGRAPFPGHGRLRDEELTRLGKENKALREAV
jgi:transposase-like protein